MTTDAKQLTKKERRIVGNNLVSIFHVPTGKWVHQIVCGYVSEPYARLCESRNKAGRFRRWEAERFLNKWISQTKAAEYKIREIQ